MEFILNGKSNKDFNLKIKNSNHLLKPKKKLELISIPGRTGDLIIDEGVRENFTLIIDLYLDIRNDCRRFSIKEFCDEIDMWLNNTKGYQTMEFDDGTVLKVIFIGEINPQYKVRNVRAD